MTRTENDLRAALKELEQRADRQGAPSTASIVSRVPEDRLGRRGASTMRRSIRWLPPVAAALMVAAAAVVAVGISQRGGTNHPRRDQHPGGHATTHRAPSAAHRSPAHPDEAALATDILENAATKLDAGPAWTTPAPGEFFYVRTNRATTWTSVSGTEAGDGRTTSGAKIWIPGCANGRIVSGGESGTCTIRDVPHYLADAPTRPSAWDGYLEHLAPGARAADAQGKIIVQVLHEDLVAPRAVAALLRYTASCPGLHALSVRPFDGERLTGVTCTTMTNGSYGLVFDADTDALAGFVGVNASGEQAGPAEVIRQTGVVAAIGRTP